MKKRRRIRQAPGKVWSRGPMSDLLIKDGARVDSRHCTGSPLSNAGSGWERQGFPTFKRDATVGFQGFVSDRARDEDELTELPNRRAFYEHVQRAIRSLQRQSSDGFAVLFVDLNYFNAVNDEYGHSVAEKLLAITARRLEFCVRSGDIVARIGDDEFAILLNGISGIWDARDAAERIEILTRQPATIGERDVRATVSVGIAIGNPKYDHPEDLLRDAGAAMYAAKTAPPACAALRDLEGAEAYTSV
jgi:diguanylate cyclase (GGDEF)-like protein